MAQRGTGRRAITENDTWLPDTLDAACICLTPGVV